MVTLKDVQDKINEIEAELEVRNLSLEDIPVKFDYAEEVNDIEIDLMNYLGHLYIKLDIN